MRTSVPLAQDDVDKPWGWIWALNVVGVLVGLLACLKPTPLTFSLAASAPFIAGGLRAWRPNAFILGDSLYRPTRFNKPAWRPLSSIVLLWAAPGFLLLFRSLVTPPLRGVAPTLLPGALVGAALASLVLLSEWRLRTLRAASSVLFTSLLMGWGYLLTANAAFDRSPAITVRGVVTGVEVLGDHDRNGPSGRGTPTLYVSPITGQGVRWRIPVSRLSYRLHGVGSQVCVNTRQGAFGWRTGRIVPCSQ